MKLKINSLKTKVWLHLAIFSILILLFLWLFQIAFLNLFYEDSKINDLEDTINIIQTKYDSDSLIDEIDNISRDRGTCVQIVEKNIIVYDSSTYNRGCIPDNTMQEYKRAFIKSTLNENKYRLINPKYNNEVLIQALRFENDVYVFSSVSLEPLDSAITILKNQFILITIIVLLLSFIIGFFISKSLSNPIERINKNAKKLAKDDYEELELKEDIDEINQLITTLNNANSELKKTEELRRELMANVSHDLKTPLTMIKAYAEMVRDLTYNNKTKRNENLNVIIEESDRLNTLVNDILELSKLESGTIELEKEEFNITKIIKSVLKRYEILEDMEKYDFSFSDKQDILVYADKKRIEQVLYNLINNAINYTGEDNKIIVNLEEKETNILIEITDTGKGIKEEDIELIWKKYYKIDKNHKRNMVGSGIGLSIVETILSNHQFNFGVNSKKGKGTTFWFEITKK